MAKTASPTTDSPAEFSAGLPIKTYDPRTVMQALTDARANMQATLFSFASMKATGDDIRPGGRAYSHSLTAEGTTFDVCRGWIYIDTDLSGLECRLEIDDIGILNNFEVDVTIGGETSNTSAVENVRTLTFDTSITGTGWQEILVQVTRNVGADPLDALIDVCIYTQAIPALSIGDPI